MTVYVDTPVHYEKCVGRLAPQEWCHMMADTTEELDAMAERIGMKKAWRQHTGKPSEHYDLTAGRRAAAVKAGAVEVTRRELALWWSDRAITRAGLTL